MSTPLSLSGATLGERRRQFNALVAQAQTQDPPSTQLAPLDALFNVQLASRLKKTDRILETLKLQDMMLVSAALRNTWLLEPEYQHIVNPTHLELTLYPEMTTPAVNKMKHWIHLNLRDSKRCQEFYEYYYAKDFGLAVKFLPRCSKEFILEKVKDVLDKLSPHTLKLLSETCPEAAKMFFDSISDNESVLAKYLEKDMQYYNSIRCVLKLNADIFLDITEKYFDYPRCKGFSSEATKFVMKNCKNRVQNKVELYASRLLDIKTMAKYLSEDEIKDIVLKLARAEYLHAWFSYQNIEPLIKRLNVKDRATFKKEVFVDKAVGDKVKEWPYKPPSRPEEQVTGTDIFHDKEHHPILHEGLMGAGFAARCYMKKKCALFSSDMMCRQQMKLPTALDQLFDQYRFDNFEKVLHELRRKMTVENQQNRQNMMLVLVSKCGGRADHVDTLLKLLLERHENEPQNLRATVVRSLVKRCFAWRLPSETWDLMLQFGRDLGLDGKPSPVPCIEGIHAIVLRNILLDHECHSDVWKAFLKDFSSFKAYSLTESEQTIVSTKLPALLLREAKSNPSEALDRLHKVLDVLDEYKIQVDKCPGVIPAVATVAAQKNPEVEHLLQRIFNARIARKELFKENFAIYQTDASYFNALKHDLGILQSGKEFEALLETGNVSHERFLRTLSLYFGEKDGLAKKYLGILERYAEVSPKKQLARPLALLGGDKLMPLIHKLDKFPKKTPPRLLSAALRANIHLSRPLLDLDAIGWQMLGAKAVANRVLTCSTNTIDSLVEKLLIWKRTLRLALVLSMRQKNEFSTFTAVASERPKLALKTALWHVRNGNKLDSRVWDVIIALISKLDMSRANSERLRSTLGNVKVVPLERKAEYCTVVFKVFERISRAAALPILSQLEGMLSEVDAKFVEDITKIFLEKDFNEENISKGQRDFNETTGVYMRVIAKFLLLSKSENTQNERIKNVGELLFERMEFLWRKYENNSFTLASTSEPNYYISDEPLQKCDIKVYLDDFILALKYTDVFLNADYVSCLPVFEFVLKKMREFVPIELFLTKYVNLHLTMLYFKAIRQSLKNNPEIFEDSTQKLKERVELVGIIFGKYIANEIIELRVKYFDSILDLYKRQLVDYLSNYFEYHHFTGCLLMVSIVKGILESDSKSHLLASYLYRREMYRIRDNAGDILERLQKSEAQDMKFFLFSDFYCFSY